MKVSLSELPLLCFKNKSRISTSTQAGCIHCCAIFEAKEITEYTDSNATCLCPKCQVDAVVGDSSGFPIDSENIKKGHEYWYKKA